MKPKTTHTNRQIPRLATATAMGIETLQRMKTRLTLLKLTILLCLTFATTAVFGQVINWTNTTLTGLGADIGNRTNWDNNPTGPVTGTTGTFSGTLTGPMNLTTSTGIIPGGANIGGSFGAQGFSFHLTPGQTSPVTLVSTVASALSIGFNSVTIDSGAGPLILGDGTLNDLDFTMRPTGPFNHEFFNNSTSTAVIGSSVTWQAGGGAAYTIIIDGLGTPGDGTGNWAITNIFGTHNGLTMNLDFLTSGTVTWNAPVAGPVVGGTVSGISSPVVVNFGCVLILKTNNLLSTQEIDHNSGAPSAIVYDGGSPLTLSGLIGGAAPSFSIDVRSGSLRLSGANIFTGDITNSGGELIAGSAENVGVSGPLGVGGVIHFFGGALGWSAANTFDYSSRFDTTTAGQAYNFDTGGQNVTLASSLGISGATLTKSGNGILTLAGTSAYGGLTTVTFGKVVFQGQKTGVGNVSVSDGAGVAFTDTGTQATPGTLTLGSVSGATLGFYNIHNTATAPVKASTLSTAGTLTVNINTGTFTVGSKYPLLTWTTGSSPTLQLGVLNGYTGFVTNDTATSVSLVITGTSYSWTGNSSGAWDLTTANNWQRNGGPVVFGNGIPTLFDDSAISGNLNVTIAAAVSPSALTVNNNTNRYQINSSAGNGITGGTGLTKNGTNALSLVGGANTYTGVTTLSGGTVNVSTLANGGLASDIGAANNNATNLVLDGGTLQYTNGTVAD